MKRHQCSATGVRTITNVRFAPWALLFTASLFLVPSVVSLGQNSQSIPACSNSAKDKFLGDRLRIQIPQGSIVKRGGDVDYSDYRMGFGKKTRRSWLYGISGPHATSGIVPKDWVSSSSNLFERKSTVDNTEIIDTKGTLPNGNHWRFVGVLGEKLSYHDVPPEAAAYFDNVMDSIC